MKFTIVELLVVISIIAILATLLFPVLHKAKESAKATNCLNSLGQLGKVFHMYAMDYGDRILPSYEGRTWVTMLEEEKYTHNILTLACQSFQNPTIKNLSSSRFYAMPRLASYSKIDRPQFYYPGSPLISPSQFPLLMDSVQASDGVFTQTYYIHWTGTANFDNSRKIHFRHSSVANVAHADGHAEAYTLSKISNKIPSFNLDNAASLFYTYMYNIY